MTHRSYIAALLAILLTSTAVFAVEAPPDLTQGDTKGVSHTSTYNLGSTGMRGWIFTKPANYLDSLQGRTTLASRQILVTHIGKNSPADGVLKVDDVILGVGGKTFSNDARKSIARAIQLAESDAGKGVLKLTRWRAGKTDDVELKLRVLGTYSDTAPYNCPKSKRIFDDACMALAKEPLNEGWAGAINGLALLSTGNPDYLPRVRDSIAFGVFEVNQIRRRRHENAAGVTGKRRRHREAVGINRAVLEHAVVVAHLRHELVAEDPVAVVSPSDLGQLSKGFFTPATTRSRSPRSRRVCTSRAPASRNRASTALFWS